MTNKLLLAFIGLGLFANAGAMLMAPARAQSRDLDLIERYLGEIAGSLGGIGSTTLSIANKHCQ